MRYVVRALIGLSVVLAAVPAAAQRVGPTVLAHGYPAWYQDASGLTLEFCQPQNAGELADGWCLLLPGDTSVPENFPDAFADEHFYFAADAGIEFTAGGVTSKALLVLAMEAAFAQGPVVAGDQVVFGRVRINIREVPYTGTYTIYHPYGTEVFELTAGERLFYTEDIGFGCATGFECALLSRPGKAFLLPADVPGGAELPAVPGPVAGKLYIADPARLGPVTGSPIGQNMFRVEGPNGFAIQTTNFALMGRVYAGAIPGKVTIDRASYSSVSGGSGASNKLDVFATAHPTTQARLPAGPPAQVVLPVLAYYPAACVVTATGALDEPDGVPGTQMFNDGAQYFGQSQPATVPAAVCVEDYTARDINGQVVPLFTQANVTDQVTITEALFDPANGGTLTVKAISSDEVTKPALSLSGRGSLLAGLYVEKPLAAAPAKVHVTSAKGGQAELQVRTVAGAAGGGGVPLAGNDEYTIDEDSGTAYFNVLTNDTLNGTAVDPGATTINLVVNSRLGTASVTPEGLVAYAPFTNAWGSEGIGYTITVGGRTSPAAYVSIIINGMNDAPAAVNDSAVGLVTKPIAINVLANDTDVDGAADLVNAVIVTPPTGATAVVGAGGVVTFTAAAGGIYTFTYRAVDGSGAQSANAATVTVNVSGAETLSIIRSEFVRSVLRWRVAGSSSLIASQVVTITYDNGTLLNGTPLQGRVIGTAVVDALGAWDLDMKLTSATDPLNPSASNVFGTRPTRVRATSALGGTATATISLK